MNIQQIEATITEEYQALTANLSRNQRKKQYAKFRIAPRLIEKYTVDGVIITYGGEQERPFIVETMEEHDKRVQEEQKRMEAMAARAREEAIRRAEQAEKASRWNKRV